MKILRENNYKHEPTMVVECRSGGFGDNYCCHSLLEVDAKDLKCGHFHISEDDARIYHYIICPVCGAKVEVNYSDIPKEVRICM